MRKKWRVFTILFATLMILMVTGCGKEETKIEKVEKCSECGMELNGKMSYEVEGKGNLCGSCLFASATLEGELEDPLEEVLEEPLEDKSPFSDEIKDDKKGYVIAVENMLEISMSKESTVDFYSLAPSTVWEYVAYANDMIGEDLKEPFDYFMGKQWEEMEAKYGNVTYSCEVLGANAIDEHTVQLIAMEMEEEFGIDRETVKEAYEVKVYLKYNSEYKHEESEHILSEEEASFTSVNIDGKWYVIEYGHGIDEYSGFNIQFKFAEEIVGDCCYAWKEYSE